MTPSLTDIVNISSSRNQATSNFKIEEVLNNLGLNTKNYMREQIFKKRWYC